MEKTIYLISYLFIGLSLLGLLYVSLLAWINPNAVMALVHVKLNKNDALSSIRGVYGGTGISLVGLGAVIAFKNPERGALFFTVFWFMYALSRVITICIDGPLGEFGNTWGKLIRKPTYHKIK